MNKRGTHLLNQRDKNLALNAFVFFSLLVTANGVLLFAIHKFLASPKSDILGAPLLLVNGSRNLQLGLFLIISLFFLPGYFFLIRVITGNFNNNQQSDRKKLVNKLWPSFELILLIFILVRLTYFSYTKMLRDFSLSPIKQVLLYLFLTMCIVFVFVLLKSLEARKSRIDSIDIGRVKNITNLILITCTGLYFYFNYASVAPRSGIAVLLIFTAIFCLAVVSGDISFGVIKKYNRLSRSFLIPLTAFFFYSKPSTPVNLHPFESHAFANTDLFLNGGLPWKDFSLEHGLWEDLGRNLFASLVSGTTDLEQAFGISTIVRPIEFSLLGICLYFISRSYWFPCLALGGSYIVNLITNYDVLYLTRLFPTLLVTLFLSEFARKRSTIYLVVLGFVSGSQVLISFEWVYSIPITILTIFWLILTGHAEVREKILGVLLYFSVLFVSILIPLLLFELVGDFVQHFFSSSGYYFAWGGNYQLGNSFFSDLILILIPLSLVLAIKQIFYNSLGRIGPRISESIWLFPLTFTLLAYFVKFMVWPDGYLIQPTSILLLLSLFVLGDYVRKNLDTFKRSTSTITSAFLILISCGMATTNIYQEELQPSSTTQIYNDVTNLYVSRIQNVNSTFVKFLPKGNQSKILDFGNEPVSWFNVLGYSTSGGVSKVLNLYSSKSQLEAIEDMTQNPPDAVIWGGEFGYWGWPFNGNWMKQYHISSWILDNYVPVTRDGNYVLMLPKLKGVPDLIALNQIKAVQCNWLNGANSFTLTQSLRSSVQRIPLSQFTTSTNSESISLRNRIDSNVLIIATNKPTNLSIVDSQGTNGQINFSTTGNYARDVIWLDQCPGYHFDGSQKRWIIAELPQGLIVKVLN
jgi:hypothetical protein